MRTPAFLLRICLPALITPGFAASQQLEIHFINVSWGGSMFIKGPDGTTVLVEAGNISRGSGRVVPYLQSIGIQPASGLDYTIAGHQHSDHLGGMDEVINAGYDVRIKNYYNGSSYSTTQVIEWNNAAATTTAGAPAIMPVGTEILLGNGARITCVARNGSIIGGGTVSVSDENDRSIALLVQYGAFDFLWASDLGGGSIDQSCTGRSTSQVDVETPLITAISPGGAAPRISSGGIDVLFANHHGSESSTNKNWMNMSQPAVAIISVGAGQSSGWNLPRRDVVENVLLAQASSCITALPALVIQTEEGAPMGSLTSTAGYCVGNIRIATDGVYTFAVSGDGQVTQGPNEVDAAGLPKTYALDDAGVVVSEYAPTSLTVSVGNLTSGGVSDLSANDGSYAAIASTTSGTRTTDWYGRTSIAESPASVTDLTVTYDGRQSVTNIAQKVYLFNYSTSAWNLIDSRTVGSSDVSITYSPATPTNYVSVTGLIRLRVFSTNATTNFTTHADYVHYTVVSVPGAVLGGGGLTATEDRPREFSLEQNYPNPFNPSTTIRFSIPHSTGGDEGGFVSLKVYDLVGREVSVLVNGEMNPGTYAVRFDAAQLSGGVYFYRLAVRHKDGGEEGTFSETRKLLLLK